ncbi:MAG: flavin reductase [Firmicutes bacterium]|nr:flavin reductase [Bacillota bacterium]
MSEYQEKDYKIFEMFSKHWALVNAGTLEDFNGCTIGWGSLGNLWGRPGHDGSSVTVYVHPGRYTCAYMKKCDTFTVSFFPEEYKKALGIMGSKSGRDGNKVEAAGLTPIAIGDSVTYKEASLTFLCRKVYQGLFDKEGIIPEVQEYYEIAPKVYPVDEDGNWQPHWMFIGEILEVKED